MIGQNIVPERTVPSFDHTTLLATYRTPRFTYGSTVTCEWRGDVVINGITDALIPWPVGKRRKERAKTLVLYADLADALRRESSSAISHWWGVSDQAITKWRRELGIDAMTEGTRLLKSAAAKSSPGIARALDAAHKKAGDPERRRKIAEARRGKPRPDHVIEAMRKANLGKKLSAETRRRMSEAKKGRPRPPRREWTREEDLLLGEWPDEVVAEKTKRTLTAVAARRKRKGIERYEG